MRIGEVTRRTGVSPRMLRYYEQQELITPGRHVNGYRDYNDLDVQRVTSVRDLSSSGVPTRFIKIILDRQSGTPGWTPRCDDILAGLIREQITDLETKISCLSSSRDALTQYLDEALPVG